MLKKSLFFTTLLMASFILTGCVVKQKVDVSYAPEKSVNESQFSKVDLMVLDKRHFVVNGQKDSSFIGLYRSGFGIPYDVNTEGNIPLAKVVSKSIDMELDALGFTKKDASKKTLNIAIKKWRFEGYQNTDFEYSLDVQVLDNLGKTIAESTVQNRQVIKGTFWMGAKGGVEQEMPKIYQDIMKKVLKENNTILTALKS